MAGRIRSIKPEMPKDEALGRCSRDARLLSRDLLTIADDYGRFRAHPAVLRGELFAYDDDCTPAMVGEWLAELEAVRYVALYTVSGQAYGQIRTWARHQRIDNAGKPLYPPPAEADGDPPQFAAKRGGPPLDLESTRIGVDQDTRAPAREASDVALELGDRWATGRGGGARENPIDKRIRTMPGIAHILRGEEP